MYRLLPTLGQSYRMPLWSLFLWSLFFCGAILCTSRLAMSEDAKDAERVIEQDEISPKGHPPSLKKPADNPTVYLWQEGEETWRLRVRTKNKKREFTGTIKVHGGKLVKIYDFSGLEAGQKKKGNNSEDFGKWNAERDQIDFKFQTHGGEDGFAFKVDSKVESVTFDLKTDNTHHPEQVRIGLKETKPPTMPFTLSNGKTKPTEKPTDETKER